MIRAAICVVGLLMSAQAGAEWRFEEIKGPNGTTAYLLQADSSIAVKGGDGKEHHPFMQLRCDEDGGPPYWRIQWFAIVETKIDSNSSRGVVVDDIRMQVRVDGKPDYRDVWDMTRDQSLEGVTTNRASALAKALRKASEVKMRISGGYGKTYDAVFDVTGLEAALEQLKGHCKRL